ncbi:MAG: hypothetical protein GX458_02665 [Phyllobacteriaceae bacterium]|nr:hypothetical protein [Phyllobacteriaceae bacterium]
MKTVTLATLSAACLALSLSAAAAATPGHRHAAAPTTGTIVAAGDHAGPTAPLTDAERYVIVHNSKHH